MIETIVDISLKMILGKWFVRMGGGWNWLWIASTFTYGGKEARKLIKSSETQYRTY
jgi:hypothetical protein